MRFHVVVAALLLAGSAHAQDRHYQSGQLLQMNSVSCGVAEKDGKSITREMLGTDSGHKKSHELLCQEYVLETDQVI